jgi:hypothetical protein
MDEPLTARWLLPGARLGACWLIAGAGLLAGCANQEKLHKEELEELVQWLPGQYDNTAQAQADERSGVQPPHEPLALAIVPIYAPTIGRNVFYLQEMAADDPRRVMSQRVLSFEASADGIRQSAWSLSQPVRWRDGHLNPDLFKSLLPDDLGAMQGCGLSWKKAAGRFVGSNDPKHCRTTSRATGVQIEARAELGPEDLSTGERSFDSRGSHVQGSRDEPLYRFRKQAQ